VHDSYAVLIAEESDKLLDDDQLVQESIKSSSRTASCSGRDRQDLRARRSHGRARRVARGRAARLLPLIEGTTVNTKHGPVKTDHICSSPRRLPISKPSDLLPELQGRLPIRVELNRSRATTAAHFD